MRFLSALFLLCLLSAGSYGQRLASFNSDGLTYGHVHLNVSDMERHKDIWVNHFGGRVVEKGRNAQGNPILTAVVLDTLLVAGRLHATWPRRNANPSNARRYGCLHGSSERSWRNGSRSRSYHHSCQFSSRAR